MSTWNEKDHPRDDDGKFTSGSGNPGSKTERVEKAKSIYDDNAPYPQESKALSNEEIADIVGDAIEWAKDSKGGISFKNVMSWIRANNDQDVVDKNLYSIEHTLDARLVNMKK